MALSQRYILICVIGFLIFLSTFPSLDATRKKGPAHHKQPPPSSDEDTSPGPSSSSPSDKDPSPGPSSSSPADKDTSPGPSSSSPADKDTSPGPSSSSPSDKNTSPGPSSSSPPTSPGGSSSSPGVFDVTKYGAVADGKTESCKAFESAWAEACNAAGQSTFLVPTGDFFVGPVTFKGPCKTAPKVEIRGTLKASTDLSVFKDVWIEFRELSNLDITGSGTGVVDGQGESSWAHKGCQNSGGKCNNPPVSLKLTKVDCGSVSNLKLLNSKGFHMNLCFSNNIKINDLTITAPGTSPNTDGIHLSDSAHIDITSSNIGVGDDCISIGQGSSDISISKINCGPGHGISVGSLGKYPNERDVTGVHVQDCKFEGTDNGVRVKTWPGSGPSKACNFTFEDIVVNNVRNPIIIDQEYCPGNKCGSKGPSKVKVSDIVFSKIRGTTTDASPVKLACSSEAVCENVKLNDIDIKHASQSPISSTCTNVKGLSITAMVNPQPCKA